ncbi:histidine ammonia-lyase [Falsarthrobacter nasiphocae]|uniref:Histidine ammonia-lyase n=1 Tax=Falsarthrobacter nasiphocae TaxID=189863 RepID=A0AAE3YHL3_9MICC|nr:histidine ammonia-lyase [Falsarthrobacter nasiphocae]MDR6891916.1 histidine ammonia-lyase [Falsarthrobacter nasiphocae]
MSLPESVTLSTSGLTADDVIAVARHDARIELAAEARERIAAVRAGIDELAASETPAYGISTGFGALANTSIPVEKRALLQKSLIRSHAAGTGPVVEREVVRALMMLRLKTLASGHTGVRPETVEAFVGLLNAGITPVVHEYGSLGCSGDLAPLSHCALVLMGEGRATDRDGVERPVPELLEEAGLAPVELEEKEGLALINGTDGMLGQLIMALADLRELVKTADVTAALVVEALRGTDGPFAPELHAPLRPHPGQVDSAANMYAVLQGSELVASHKKAFGRVQDAYSLRCAPQVAGGLRDTIDYVTQVAARELAAAVDNPVVLDSGEVRSNGNFHGAPVAYVLDFLAIPVADLASMSERRTDRLLDPARSHGLPPFLAADPGTDSGLMIAQYTQAGLVAEMKRLAVPASVDSIPSSAMQEDHVSLGWHAARKLRTSVDNLRRVLAIELLAAARAIDFRGVDAGAARDGSDALPQSGNAGSADGTPLPSAAPGPVAASVMTALRESVPGPGPDRFLAPDIAGCEAFIASGALLEAVRAAGVELR